MNTVAPDLVTAIQMVTIPPGATEHCKGPCILVTFQIEGRPDLHYGISKASLQRLRSQLEDYLPDMAFDLSDPSRPPQVQAMDFGRRSLAVLPAPAVDLAELLKEAFATNVSLMGSSEAVFLHIDMVSGASPLFELDPVATGFFVVESNWRFQRADR